MKKILTFILLVVVLYACKQIRKNNERFTFPLYGEVKQLIQVNIKLDSLGIPKADSVTTTFDFDKWGYFEKVISKDTAGTKEQKFLRYDNGLYKDFSVFKNNKLQNRWTAELDKAGKYSEVKLYDSANKQNAYITDIKSNEYDIPVSWKQYDMNKKFMIGYTSQFKGKIMISNSMIDSNGKRSFETLVTLNDKEEVIAEKSITLIKDSMVTKETTYTYENYDKAGNWQIMNSFEKGKKVAILKRSLTYYK